MLAALALLYGLHPREAHARTPARSPGKPGARPPRLRELKELSEAQLGGQDPGHVQAVPLGQANEVLLQREVAEHFLALREAAAAAGFQLRIASGFRSFSRQRQIWNDKLAGRRTLLDAREKPLRAAALPPRERVFALLYWSALPGASRHHWGTDLDVYDGAVLPRGHQLRLTRLEADTVFAGLHRWLDQRIASDRAFGFYRPYRGQGGVSAEPWHLSYRPLARLCEPRITPGFVRRVLGERKIALKRVVLDNLPQIHERFIAPYHEA